MGTADSCTIAYQGSGSLTVSLEGVLGSVTLWDPVTRVTYVTCHSGYSLYWGSLPRPGCAETGEATGLAPGTPLLCSIDWGVYALVERPAHTKAYQCTSPGSGPAAAVHGGN